MPHSLTYVGVQYKLAASPNPCTRSHPQPNKCEKTIYQQFSAIFKTNKISLEPDLGPFSTKNIKFMKYHQINIWLSVVHLSFRTLIFQHISTNPNSGLCPRGLYLSLLYVLGTRMLSDVTSYSDRPSIHLQYFGFLRDAGAPYNRTLRLVWFMALCACRQSTTGLRFKACDSILSIVSFCLSLTIYFIQVHFL